MRTPQTSITRMFSQSPVATAGRADQARAGLKNVSWTRGQPGVAVMPRTSTRATTTVLPSATRLERRARRCR